MVENQGNSPKTQLSVKEKEVALARAERRQRVIDAGIDRSKPRKIEDMILWDYVSLPERRRVGR